MEIVVKGKSKKYASPDQVILNINFNIIATTYESALENGSKSVNTFINEVLKSNGFDAQDMKTHNFTISKEKKYNKKTDEYYFIGYAYNQDVILKFDYDKNKMFKIMDSISKLNNPPKYEIDFGIKDENKSREDIIKNAYIDAESQAKAIAESAGKKLKECAKVSFTPFESDNLSYARLDSDMLCECNSVPRNLGDSFVPEDIELTETLYCLWIAE